MKPRSGRDPMELRPSHGQDLDMDDIESILDSGHEHQPTEKQVDADFFNGVGIALPGTPLRAQSASLAQAAWPVSPCEALRRPGALPHSSEKKRLPLVPHPCPPAAFPDDFDEDDMKPKKA